MQIEHGLEKYLLLIKVKEEIWSLIPGFLNVSGLFVLSGSLIIVLPEKVIYRKW